MYCTKSNPKETSPTVMIYRFDIEKKNLCGSEVSPHNTFINQG